MAMERPLPPPPHPVRKPGFWGALTHAWDGLVWATAHQRNMKIHVVSGMLVGCVGAWWGASFLGSLLYGVRPQDPGPLLIAIGTLLLTSAIAALAPMRRAVRLDPARLLRRE